MKKEFNVLVFDEGDKIVVRCCELLVTETGNSIDEALENLKNTIKTLAKDYDLVEMNVDFNKIYEKGTYTKKKIVVDF